MTHSTKHFVAIAIACAFFSLSGPAVGTTIAGAGQAPVGANDIDVFFTSANKNPALDVKDARTTINGNPRANVTTPSPGVGKAHWEGAMDAGTVYGWALVFKGPAKILNWYFTKDGDQLGPNQRLPDGAINPILGPATLFDASITNPVPSDAMAISGFQIFTNQSPSLGSNTLALADFSSTPFIGSPVSGIPTTFTLDSSNPSMNFSASDFAGLVTRPGTLVFYEGIVNGTTYFRVEATVVPEPSTIAMFGFGLAFIAFAIRRRGMPPSSRKGIRKGADGR